MRTNLYLLAAGLFDQPDHEHTGRLRGLLLELAARLAVDEEDIAAEYTRLFVLAVPQVAAQPFGSCWLEPERGLMGRTTVEVREMMAAHGLEPARGLLPDHIVSELEFMAWLSAEEAHADTRETQRHLLNEHLARWVPRFNAALRAARPSPRFLLAADLLDRLLAEDARRLNGRRAGLSGGTVSLGLAP
jgi:TorA maturation chaperone TorD